jgi:hypothetical protein
MFSSWSKSATTIGLNISEYLLLLFGLVLVIGLIGEYRPKWESRKKLFELLVIIGVAGELLADGGIFAFSRRLQIISDAEVASLNKEAGEARQKAGEAIERSEQDRLARVKIEQRLGHRDISPEQADLIISALAPFKGRKFHFFGGEPNDSEAGHFTSVLLTIFMKAGLKFPDGAVRGTASSSEVGPGLTFGMGNGADDLAVAVMNALTAADLSSLLILTRRSDDFPKGELAMWIGRKP